MLWRIMTISIVFLATGFSCQAQLAGAAATGLLIAQIKAGIQSIIDQASNRADYLAFRAGTELRNTIDSWEKANASLLDQAFKDLSVAQQNFLNGIDLQRKRLAEDAGAAAEVATKVSEIWAQSISDAKFWQDEVAFYRISSPILSPTGGKSINLIVRGINIDKANPQLIVASPGIQMDRTYLTKQEVHFAFERSKLPFAADSVVEVKATLIFTQPGTFFSKAQEREYPVSFMLLPINLGRLEVSAITQNTIREPLWKEREFSYSSNDGCDIQNQGPSNDFKINVDSIRPYARPNPDAGKVIQIFGAKITFPPTLPAEWGRGGSWRIESSSPNGFSVKLCASRWWGPGLDTGPGNQHVYLRWEEYRERTEDQTIPVVIPPELGAGVLTWNKDIPVPIPSTAKGVAVRFVNFQGKITETAGSFGGPGIFAEIEWNPGTRQLIVRPKIPTDVGAL
jgi:hypothetical protein